MSVRTRGVAVAVNAWMAASGKASRRTASCRYSGRKSCPHWLMQWASSMAKNATPARLSNPRQVGSTSRSGATYSR